MKWLTLMLLGAGIAAAQTGGDVIGVHDLSPGSKSPATGTLSGACLYCHAPHGGIGGRTPLWNQKLSTQFYTPYTSTTEQSKGTSQPAPGTATVLCLSCHDGTVAPGQTQAYGTIALTGGMKSIDLIPNLQSSHPNSLQLPLKDDPTLVATLTTNGRTADPTHKIHLVKGNIECNTCHNPHVQAGDTVSQNFLVTDSSRGQMCLACHDPNRSVNGQSNPIGQWSTGAHAVATNAAATGNPPPVGSYATVAQNACLSCHQVHNAPGGARLLRASNEQDCMLCHAGGSNIKPAIPNVFAEFAKGGHPFPSSNNQHDAAENVLLNQNRHSTCADCHNAHSSSQVTTFTAPPALRGSQNNVSGISAGDGVSPVNPSAVNQYENCFRCHGTSIGKATNPTFGYLPMWMVSAGDPLNVILQFAASTPSSHPVTHDRSSGLLQPSLRGFMLKFDGKTPARAMGARIFCTDCHNSDDNREFGGSGPNGPHGSQYPHILERRYEFSQAPKPGGPISNLFPFPDLGPYGPYALCGKCHDLAQVMLNTSFSEHNRHISDGFSCSTCHTAHGVGNMSGTISGKRLVNFDANVVAGNGIDPISYSQANNTCLLACHSHNHVSPSNSSSRHKSPVKVLRPK